MLRVQRLGNAILVAEAEVEQDGSRYLSVPKNDVVRLDVPVDPFVVMNVGNCFKQL
ncbi:hypothetical protein D3C71_1671770 [compost metagenome]